LPKEEAATRNSPMAKKTTIDLPIFLGISKKIFK
jgi:hypothetical protein